MIVKVLLEKHCLDRRSNGVARNVRCARSTESVHLKRVAIFDQERQNFADV